MGARPSTFAAAPATNLIDQTVVQEGRKWSDEQMAIFDFFATGTGNLIVDAVAGSGKTTTIVEGVKRAPEKTPLVCAFNKKIAEELNGRLQDSYATAKTLHSLGYGMIRRQWRGMPVANESDRQEYLTDAVVGKDTPKQIRRLVSMLHTKAREMCPLDYREDVLTGLALRFDYVPDEGWGPKYDVNYVVNSAKAAIDHAANEMPRRDIGIDYADMVFLPLAWNLTSKDFDLVVVDEAQDMTMAQLEIAERVCSGRIVIVGDRHQAIYGFRGADTASLDRLKRKLSARELPLSTTYRCGKAIVAHVQRLVPHIQARADAHEGQVSSIEYDRMMADVATGDFVLSRINAPLVSITLSLLRQGKRARMAGRDVGAGIMAILKRIKVYEDTPLDFALQRLDDWEKTTCTRLATYGQVDLLARTHDQADMIRAFVADADSARDMLDKMRWLFTDVKENDQIICSSVHKAKGLEADRVWLLQESLYRRGETDEERNIEYVGGTRAKQTLHLVEGVPSLRTE